MMMNRDKLGFWARVVAIVLSLIFIGSFLFLGIGSNLNYNLFDLIGGQNQQQDQQDSAEQQVQAAEQNLKENPNDPDAIKTTAGLYISASRYDDAERVLKHGKEVAPKDAEMAILLGQVYDQRARSAGVDGREEAYRDAGEEYVAATKIDSENADAFLLAGQAYEQAGDPGRAIQYYNGYLDRDPNGQNADAVKARVEQLLAGEETTADQQ